LSRLIARLASGLKKLPSEVRGMRMSEARAITDFWCDCPPEGEMLALLAEVYTTWRPASRRVSDAASHRRSLEERWAAGAMNAKQLLAVSGGAPVAVRIDGAIVPVAGSTRPFPGSERGD
jgi:hypothetical protein